MLTPSDPQQLVGGRIEAAPIQKTGHRILECHPLELRFPGRCVAAVDQLQADPSGSVPQPYGSRVELDGGVTDGDHGRAVPIALVPLVNREHVLQRRPV